MEDTKNTQPKKNSTKDMEKMQKQRNYHEKHYVNESENEDDNEKSKRETEGERKLLPFIDICFETGGKEFNIQSIADTGSSRGIMSSEISEYYLSLIHI